MPLQHLLDYEPVRPKRPPIWRRSLVLWVVICIIGYCCALCGPLGVAGGIISMYVDRQGSLPQGVLGVPVQTLTQKLVLTLSYLVISALGLGFVACVPPSQALRRRGINGPCGGPEPRG